MNVVIPQLGLVCVTYSDEVRFRTITRTRYLRLADQEREQTLRDLYQDNLRRLYKALDFCRDHSIHLYRISSGLFPFSDEELGGRILEAMQPGLSVVGKRAAEYAIRLLMHPDQFVVLSSDSPSVVQIGRTILEKHGRTFDLFALPRSPWSAINIHGGKGGRAGRLVQEIAALPDSIRSRLTLENDERAYSAYEILDICRRAGIPMIFDAHHHVCKEGLSSYEDPSIPELVRAARDTWPDPSWQIVHLSNGKSNFSDPRHSDLISTVPDIYREVPWIEVEAKNKEQAIEGLRAVWHCA